jgi:hypothetical protein
VERFQENTNRKTSNFLFELQSTDILIFLFDIIPIIFKLIQSQEKVTDYAEMAKLFKINATGLEETSESK